MAYTVEIYDPSTTTTYNITSRTRLVQISEVLDSGVTGFKVECRAITSAHFFHHLTVKSGATTIITGIIVDQSDRDAGGEKQTIFTCQDYGYFLTKRIVAESYTSKTASYMLSALMTKYFTEGTGTNIDTSTEVITESKFTYVTLKDAIEYIMGMSYNWHYYIDKTKDFHFFYSYESSGTTITTAKIKTATLQVDYEGIDHYNRVWIVGRKQPSTNAINVYYTADGEQKYFGPLPYEPANLAVYFTPSGLPEYQLIIVSQGSDISNAEAVYNSKNRTFYLVDPSFYIGKLRANFKPMQQFIEYFENNSDKALYGLMEKVVKNKDVTDKLEARRYGKAEVQKSSSVKRTIRFSSDHADVRAASIGQKLTMSIATSPWSVTGDFLVTRMERTIRPETNYATVTVEMEEL